MFKKSLSFILISSLLLLGCDFRPEHKVIEYQEEVKLSDGSFIWVDIKRHYRLAGEPFQEMNYLPSIVEISWDTGFEGVGRQSVFFDGGVVLIDKIDNVWYVVGGKPSFNGAYVDSKAVNCRDVGVLINNGYTCTYILDQSGVKLTNTTTVEQFVKSIKINILTLTGLSDWVHNSNELPNSKLTWINKQKLDGSKNSSRQSLGKSYSEF